MASRVRHLAEYQDFDPDEQAQINDIIMASITFYVEACVNKGMDELDKSHAKEPQ